MRNSRVRGRSWKAVLVLVTMVAASAVAVAPASATAPKPKPKPELPATTPSEQGDNFAAGRRTPPSRSELIAAAHAAASTAATPAAAGMATTAADTGYALRPAAPLPQCVYGTIYNWPKVYEQGTTNPCWVKSPGGTNMHLVGPTPSQTLYPNSELHMGVADSYGGWENKAAFMLSWNNLWDYQPLMGGSNGLVGNDYTDRSLWVIPPSIDNSGCYDTTQAYLYGRFVYDCGLKFGKGPYYGTPAGQELPYTRFVGSSWAGGRYNSPFPSNCGGTCALNFSYYSGAYMEMPIFIEPSPYAGFQANQTGATVKFTDTTLADLQETSWQWSFGDGKTSTDQNPIHNYDHLGTFPVTLKVAVADGQTDTMAGSITVTAQYKISGTVKNLSGSGVQTTLTMTNTGDASVQSLQVAADGTYSVAVDPGNYKIVTDPAAPTGTFTPTQRTVAITNANKTANFTANTRKLTVTIADNVGRPVPGVVTTITGTGAIYGSLTSDAAGVAKVEVASGTYTLTPQDLHPGQGYQFIPPNATAVVSGADVAKSFVYKAAVFVTSVTPNVGPANGGTSVTVTGGGFKQGGVASVSAVKFRSLTKAVTGVNVVVQSDSVLTVTTPKAQSLFTAQDSNVSTDVRVTSGAYTSGVTTDDVYVFGNVPQVTKVAVDDGPIIGGTKIKITGRHFTGATAITFEPVDALPVLKATKVTIDSDTQISVTVPGMALSNFGRHVADVRVKSPDGKSPTGFADHFTYRPVNVMQLGDSIAAGEGINYGYTYDPATGYWTPGTAVPVWDGPYPLCHQSSQAYSHYVAAAIGAQLTTLACTGATYDHGVHGDQPSEGAPAQFGIYPGGPLNAKYDAANPDVVLISLGADDIVFSEVVGDCVKSYAAYLASGLHVPFVCTSARPGAVVTADFFGNLPGVATHLTQLIHDIEQRGLDSPSGVAPKIVVQDYFDPFPTDRTAFCPDSTILDPTQIAYLSGLVGKLDTKIANTVRGIAAADKNVQFLELKQAFVGHQWCDADPWAYGISIRTHNLELSSQAPFHPTPAGQQFIADAVLPKVKALLPVGK